LDITQAQNSPANILIVDDTPDNLDLLASILNKRGYQTRCVENGAMALEIAHSGWAELILLDIQMPQMDGYEVCQKLKAESATAEIPVIFISALNDFYDKKKAFAVGGVDYITKPFEIKEVVVRVANQIAIYSGKSQIIELNNQLERKVKERTVELETRNKQLKLEIDRRQQAQDNLLRMALNDPITGLANRNSFISRLKQALKVTEQRPDYFFAVILLECDRFKTIKRTISHIEGNQLLMAIGNVLGSGLDKSSLLSRLEGDEFAIFLDNIQDVQDAVTLVRQIQQKLTQPFSLARRKVLINVNVGIAIGNKDYQDIDRLFNDADIAMQQAKTLRGDRCQVFQPDMYIQLQDDMELANRELELKQAIKCEEFVNYYLPTASLKTRSIVELEALIRWHHPIKGVVLPDDFIPTAEETGLIISLGDIVLKQACQQIKHWQMRHEHQSNLNICINLSAKQLFHPNLIPKIDVVLRKTQLQGHHLKLEIAETVIIENPTVAFNILQQLKKRQVRLSLDNFGVGYSSLTCLHRFPFDDLKIDRSLIANFSQDNPNLKLETATALLIQQIIAIAHQMNMVVTATGIETNYQLNQLKNLGCDHGQGYLISKLLDRDSVEDFLVWAIK
jgi:diguanylate cyclase (GGDEF)-like protein